jgi:hypothetical protein
MGLYSLDDFLADAANFTAGFGDTLTWGVTNAIRDQMGTNDVVNRCSGMYSAGEWTGVGASTVIGGAGGWKAAGQKALGKEFSHWIPDRVLKQSGSDFLRNTFGRSRLNGNYVTAAEHALNDPYRYQLMPRAWKEANRINSAVVR